MVEMEAFLAWAGQEGGSGKWETGGQGNLSRYRMWTGGMASTGNVEKQGMKGGHFQDGKDNSACEFWWWGSSREGDVEDGREKKSNQQQRGPGKVGETKFKSVLRTQELALREARKGLSQERTYIRLLRVSFKIPQTGCLTQQKFIIARFWRLEAQGRCANRVSFILRFLILACRHLPSYCKLMWLFRCVGREREREALWYLSL